MINPTRFENNIDNIPITWEHIQPMSFDEFVAADPDVPLFCYEKGKGACNSRNEYTLEYVSALSTVTESDAVTNFQKLISS